MTFYEPINFIVDKIERLGCGRWMIVAFSLKSTLSIPGTLESLNPAVSDMKIAIILKFVTKVRKTRMYHKSLVSCSVALLLFFVSIPASGAVTKYGTGPREKLPSAIEFEDIWFYDGQMKKVIPHIDLAWITYVFSSDLIRAGGPIADEELISQMARELVKGYEEIVDWFYDRNISEDACFFRLRDGITIKELQSLIPELNKYQFVSYTHPVLRIRDRIYVFFDAFEMEWKTGIAPEIKEQIMRQAHVSFDKKENIYRVNVFRLPFFKSLTLLAEDIHVLKATPYLVELVPTISADLSLTINGGNIGDKIPFIFSVKFSDRINIDPSSIANLDVRPLGIQKELFELRIDPYDYVEVATRSPIRITGWLKIYTPGEFTIPPVKIKYTCLTRSGTRVRTTETNKVVIKVSSIVPSKQATNKLIIPSNYLSPDRKIELYHKKAIENLILSLTAFIITIICIGWFIKTVYMSIKQKKRLQAVTDIDILEDKLRKLLYEEPSPPHWSYVAELSNIFRQYLLATFNIPYHLVGGSGETFFESINEMLPEHVGAAIQNIFKTVDNIVALEMTSYSEMESFKAEILKIIESRKT